MIRTLKKSLEALKPQERHLDSNVRYTKDDLEKAVAAVHGGVSLGKASLKFKVPKETIRQAKIKSEAMKKEKKQKGKKQTKN